MSSLAEKGGGAFRGIKLLLCENPLPPIDEAIAAAQRSREILVKPLDDTGLGPGHMRITTALPDDNRRFIDALRTLLK